MLEYGGDLCASIHNSGISRAMRSAPLDTPGAMKIPKRIKPMVKEGRIAMLRVNG